MFYVNNIATNTIDEKNDRNSAYLDSVLRVDIDICVFIYLAHSPDIFKPLK